MKDDCETTLEWGSKIVWIKLERKKEWQKEVREREWVSEWQTNSELKNLV